MVPPQTPPYPLDLPTAFPFSFYPSPHLSSPFPSLYFFFLSLPSSYHFTHSFLSLSYSPSLVLFLSPLPSPFLSLRLTPNLTASPSLFSVYLSQKPNTPPYHEPLIYSLTCSNAYPSPRSNSGSQRPHPRLVCDAYAGLQTPIREGTLAHIWKIRTVREALLHLSMRKRGFFD